jgi:NCAIR mutase (PurE)-related protein
LNDLAAVPSESLGFATIDHHRSLRQGFPEVIFGAGKTADQIVAIAERIADRSGGFLATRVSDDGLTALEHCFPAVEINRLGRTAHLQGAERPAAGKGTVLIVTAGTSDLPVAEEAAVTACALGNRVARLTDVGVAGLHRILACKDDLLGAAVVIVIAGMDGALASVIGGLVRGPVIAVPTSVGYGAAFGGLAPLLTMLNSCAAGVTVVNIDNGFGAAMAATRINQL